MKLLKKTYIFGFLVILFLTSCQNETEFIIPEFTSDSYLKNSSDIKQSIRDKIDGIYAVQGKLFQLSENVVIKCTKEHISIFSGKNIDYFLLKGGIVDSNIIFEGYSRVAESLSSGLARFQIKSDSGGSELIKGKNSDIYISGSYDVEGSQRTVLLKKIKPLKDDSDFYIIAHRGGGRNSDYLSVSENSLPMIRLSEAFGTNAIEIDVRLTKDKVPILYHDDELNSRLILGEFGIGPVENYPFSHIRTFCRLLNNEVLPTLQEALETVITDTKLKLVWLDIKSPETMDIIIPIIDEYQKKAKTAKRNVKFVIGISSEEIRDKYLSKPEYKNYEALSELSMDETKQAGAIYWAPRWTLGSLSNEINQIHSLNRKIFFWTMDDRVFINKYLRESDPDGILSNYPAIVAYEYYIK